MDMAYNKKSEDGLNAVQRYQAKCDCITIRPLKADGEKIRSAAAKAGVSVTKYIMTAVKKMMDENDFKESKWGYEQ